jgi:hypothetical protein
MTEFYKFAGEHPFLTFLLAVIIGETIIIIINSIASIFKK